MRITAAAERDYVISFKMAESNQQQQVSEGTGSEFSFLSLWYSMFYTWSWRLKRGLGVGEGPIGLSSWEVGRVSVEVDGRRA